MRHIALNLLRQETASKGGVKAKRLKAGWDEDYLIKVRSLLRCDCPDLAAPNLIDSPEPGVLGLTQPKSRRLAHFAGTGATRDGSYLVGDRKVEGSNRE